MSRWGGLLAGVALLAVVATGCGDADIEVSATFDDVADLTTNAAVKVADVDVGRVSDIELDDAHRAAVTLELDGDRAIPSGTAARLRKTNVLGERFVELVPPEDPEGRLADGDVIAETSVVPEIEEAIFTGTEVVAAIAADALAGAIDAGAEGTDGRADSLGAILDDLGEVTATYDDASGDLVRLIDGLDAFLGEAGPRAERHGEALAEVARFFEVLEEEDDRLIDSLGDARELAVTGTDIIDSHRGRIDAQLERLDGIADEIVARDADLDRLFVELAEHNTHTFRGVNSEFAQIVLDVAVCGLNTTEGDNVRGCERVPQSRPDPQPRPRQDY